MRTKLLVLSAAVLVSGTLASSAAAATDLHDVQLDGLVTERAVNDRVADDITRATPTRVERFVDAHGHQITIGTDISTLDLSGYAAVLGQTLHANEISDLFVEVVPWAAIEAACGGGAGVVGCYSPARKWMIVTDYDPAGVEELVHTIVHEYGHHVDGYLDNIGHFDPGCVGGDGSRSWWWIRVPASFKCYGVPWERLIAELFAEDYTAAHGIVGWQLSTIGPPSSAVKNAIAYDFANRFQPRSLRASAVVPRRKSVSWSFAVKHWTFLTATLRGPNRADLDLYLFRRGAQRPMKKSARRGSSERIVHAIRPGAYEIVAHAFRARGRATVRLRLE